MTGYDKPVQHAPNQTTSKQTHICIQKLDVKAISEWFHLHFHFSAMTGRCKFHSEYCTDKDSKWVIQESEQVKVHMLMLIYSLYAYYHLYSAGRLNRGAICSMKKPLKNTCAAALGAQALLWSNEAEERGQTTDILS